MRVGDLALPAVVHIVAEASKIDVILATGDKERASVALRLLHKGKAMEVRVHVGTP